MNVLIDNVKITTEDLNKYKENRFYYINYEIPIGLTKGKSKVVVKLLPKEGNSAGPVYGSRMVKD